MDDKEIELKLAVPRDALARVRRSGLVTRHRQGKPAIKRLRSIYYDTPNHDLAREGITVRLRQSGSVWLQTVKTAGDRASGLFSRQEWEAPVAGETLDGRQLRATGLPQLQDEHLADRLSPLFATEVKRIAIPLGGEGWRAELALDEGLIMAGEAREAIAEIEIELQEGSPDRLFALAHDIAELVPARLLASSKSDRGYALAAGTTPAPVKAKPVQLGDGMDLGEAFRAIARNCLHHLLANERALLQERDPEAIHQMRVALRRLRSALKVFGPLVKGPQLAQIRAEIRWLLAVLGPARDSEVFLAEIVVPVAEKHAGPVMTDLHHHWDERRAHDFAAAVAAVEDRRFTALLLDLGSWVEAGDWCTDSALPGPTRTGEMVKPFARAVLDKLAKRLRKAAGKRLEKLSPAHLHEVRILGKQLRYACEFFAPLYGKPAVKPYLSALSKLQEVLGQINDIVVAGEKLGSGGPHDWASGMVAGWHQARRPKLVKAADKAWKRLGRTDRFWAG